MKIFQKVYLTVMEVHLLQSLCFVLMVKFATTGIPKPDGTELECLGKLTFPLDEGRIKVQEQRYGDFQIINSDSQPISIQMHNDGHSLMVHLNYSDDNGPILSGGPLTNIGNYTPIMFYFHWLEKTHPKYDYGNISFPAELHLVWRNNKYKSLSNASNKKNGLVIFAYPIQVGPFPSTYFDIFTQYLPLIRQQDDRYFLSPDIELSLDYFVRRMKRDFYTYHSSMLSVACFEDIIFFDFPDIVGVKPDFVQQVEYLEVDNEPVMKQVLHREPPKGPFFKSKPFDEEDQSAIPLIDTLNNAIMPRMNIFLLILEIIIYSYLY